MFKLYNPEFLFRLLSLVYKCVILELDQVSIVCTPKNIAILLSLLRTSPPPAKILLTKILVQLLKILPIELFEDSVVEFLSRKKASSKASYINKDLSESPNMMVSLLVSIVHNIRKRTFQENIDYPEDYTFSSEIINVIRELLNHSQWQSTVKEYLDYLLSVAAKHDILYTIIAF